MVDKTYLPNKTVTLKEDNLNTSNTPPPLAKTIVKTSDNYLSHKTVNLAVGIVSEKKEEKISEKKEDKVPEKKEEKPKEEQLNTPIKQSTTPVNIDSKANYPTNKTVNLGGEVSSEKKEEKSKEEQLYAPKNPAPPAVNIDSKTNYPSHRTINLSGEITGIKQEEKPAVSSTSEVKITITQEEQTKVQSTTIETSDSKLVVKHTEYAEHKTVTISGAEVSSNDSTSNKQQVTDRQPITTEREIKKEDYPKPKTETISGEEKPTIVKDAENVAIVSPVNESESKTSGITTGTVQGNYPIHKSFSFIKEEAKTVKEDTKAPIINPAKAEQTENKISPVKKEEATVKGTVKPQTIIVQVKAKKPVLWMIMSITLFLTSAAAGWFIYHQQSTFKGEIALLQQNTEDLTDSIKKLQKDKLHFDDLIIRGGKIDPKNNITVMENASESEAIRICFSISSNQYAAKGKKTVYIRLIDPNNNVMVKAKENLFEYKRKQIPYSLTEEVEYKNQELMLCFDYKPDEKLIPGNYKAEIYNDGVLDGVGTFELK